MLLRRIREHVTAHNWFAVSVDLVIVVLGVFLGIQVSNWNTERVEHERGEIYRARIIRDLEVNQTDMQHRAAYYRQVREFGLQVLGDLDGSARLADEPFLIAAYQATQLHGRPMARSTYDEILDVGALATLGDVSQRDWISTYYLTVDASRDTFSSTPPYREIVRRAIPYRVQERIRTACPETTPDSTSGVGYLTLTAQCTLGLNHGEMARAAARVRATPGLELDVTRLLADLDQKLIQTERMQRRAHDLAAELRRH
jgi:hypothetical protein